MRAVLAILLASMALESIAIESPQVIDKARMTACEEGQGGTWEFDTLQRKWVCNPQSMKQCIASGGRWHGGPGVTMTGLGTCLRVAKDGGKRCTEGAQCEFGCRYTGTGAADSQLIGVCSSDNRGGCGQWIVNGKLVPGACD